MMMNRMSNVNIDVDGGNESAFDNVNNNDDDQDNFNDDDQAQGAGVQRRLLSLRQVPRQWKFRQVRSWH